MNELQKMLCILHYYDLKYLNIKFFNFPRIDIAESLCLVSAWGITAGIFWLINIDVYVFFVVMFVEIFVISYFVEKYIFPEEIWKKAVQVHMSLGTKVRRRRAIFILFVRFGFLLAFTYLMVFYLTN